MERLRFTFRDTILSWGGGGEEGATRREEMIDVVHVHSDLAYGDR